MATKRHSTTSSRRKRYTIELPNDLVILLKQEAAAMNEYERLHTTALPSEWNEERVIVTLIGRLLRPLEGGAR